MKTCGPYWLTQKRTRLLMKIAQTEISLAVSCQTLVVTMNASIHLWQENFLCVFVKAISLSKIKQMIWYFDWTAVQVAAQKKKTKVQISVHNSVFIYQSLQITTSGLRTQNLTPAYQLLSICLETEFRHFHGTPSGLSKKYIYTGWAIQAKTVFRILRHSQVSWLILEYLTYLA